MAEIYPYLQFGERYAFTTAQNVTVVVHMPLDGRWFPDNPEIANVHDFFIETDKPSMGLDILLRNTVLDILNNFLKKGDRVIVYYCDPHDGRGHKRYAKFNRWFGFVNDPLIEKHDRQVFVTDLKIDDNDNLVRSEITVYASILLHRNNPNYAAVMRIFHSGDLDKTDKL